MKEAVAASPTYALPHDSVGGERGERGTMRGRRPNEGSEREGESEGEREGGRERKRENEV